MISVTVGKTRLVLREDDITRQDSEAIVNAANSTLLGGGGVDGAIHRAGGPRILAECRAIREKSGECPTGQAVITTGGQLKARYVIHTVGPVWRGGGHNEETLLASAYRNCLKIARDHQIRTISFPSISTGVYGFPADRASKIAFGTVGKFVDEHDGIEEVRFVVFSQKDYQHYAGLFEGTD